MKNFPKIIKDFSKQPDQEALARIGYSDGPVEELVKMYRDFFRAVNPVFFDWVVKITWLKGKTTFDGARRSINSNGYRNDYIFSSFMKCVVGISQKPFAFGLYTKVISSYFKDFFPNFSDHNPFTEPEYFKYPYKHVTLDHLAFVYQVHDRLEMLTYADENKMTIHQFENWALNRCTHYSDTQPQVEYKGQLWPCYMVFRDNNNSAFMRDLRKKHGR